MKQIVSFSLEQKNITILEDISSAFGKNRSEFLDFLIENFYTPDIKKQIEQMNVLKNKIRR